jgi:hypothetical protein
MKRFRIRKFFHYWTLLDRHDSLVLLFLDWRDAISEIETILAAEAACFQHAFDLWCEGAVI